MGRAPCCAKMGLKKGPWSHEEDEVLISYIQQHGHPNWRALPKHAGLLRCGKSCRLRWINYLSPDIKRGNFTKQEEDVIINLHGMLGNRWSVIAAKLPGRTDNEIKNVWHTHLKKRQDCQQTTICVPKRHHTKSKHASNTPYPEVVVSQSLVQQEHNSLNDGKLLLHQPSSSESSLITEVTIESPGLAKHQETDHETFLDDNFWSETLSSIQRDNDLEYNPMTDTPRIEMATSMVENMDMPSVNISCDMDGMDLWYDQIMYSHFTEYHAHRGIT